MADEPLFCIVSTVNPTREDFVTIGIFTKPEDAEAFAAPYRDSERHCNVGHVEAGVTMAAILDRLARDRLGAVAAALEKLGLDLSAVK